MNENKICKMEGCNNPVRCKELCHKHYNRKCYSPEKQSKYDRSPRRRFKRLMDFCANHPWPTDLTFESWQEIIKDNKCYYCPNTLPTNGYALDRKYPSVGYFKKNVVPCCDDCNKTKRDLYSHIEFKVMMDALNEFRRKFCNYK